MITIAVGFMMLLPNANTFIANVSDPSSFGLYQGVAETLGRIFRAVGPLIMGGCYSLSLTAFDHVAVPFYGLALMYLLTGLCSKLFLPTSIAISKKDLLKKSTPVHKVAEGAN